MDDDRRRQRAREFSRRELLRAGWALPVVASIAAACSDGGDWTGLRERERASGAQRREPQLRSQAHADAEHIDTGTGVEHADLPHADAGPVGPPSDPSTTTRRTDDPPSHSDRGRHADTPHDDVPVHWDTPHADEHTDFGGPDTNHLDTPYGDHIDSSSGFEVHDDSPHVDEQFVDESLGDHGDIPHVDIPHGDTIV